MATAASAASNLGFPLLLCCWWCFLFVHSTTTLLTEVQEEVEVTGIEGSHHVARLVGEENNEIELKKFNADRCRIMSGSVGFRPMFIHIEFAKITMNGQLYDVDGEGNVYLSVYVRSEENTELWKSVSNLPFSIEHTNGNLTIGSEEYPAIEDGRLFLAWVEIHPRAQFEPHIHMGSAVASTVDQQQPGVSFSLVDTKGRLRHFIKITPAYLTERAHALRYEAEERALIVKVPEGIDFQNLD